MRDSDTRFTKAMIDAMTLAEFEKLTPEQKIIIDIAQYAETEEYSKMWTAHNDGKREGIEQGREEGQLEAKFETARNLLNMGLSIEQIAQATGLDIEQVTEIQTQNGFKFRIVCAAHSLHGPYIIRKASRTHLSNLLLRSHPFATPTRKALFQTPK